MIIKNDKGTGDLKFITLGGLTFLLLGFFSAILTGGTELYGTLNMPPLSPPPVVFSVVWSILYVLIGGTFGAVYSYTGDVNGQDRRNGLVLSVLSLVFNLLWTPLYFGKGQLLAALIDLVMITILTVTYAKYFYKVKKLYGYLTIPYIAWLLFALYLNIGVVILN